MRPVSPVRLARLCANSRSVCSSGVVFFHFLHQNQTRCRAIERWKLLVVVSVIFVVQRIPDRGLRNYESLRRKDSIPCETIHPIASHLSRSTGLAPVGGQCMGLQQFPTTQLTLYWLSTRSTVVSLGSNLKTCFRSAGPSTASSRAQSISSGSRTSRRPAGCSMVQGSTRMGALGSVDRVERAAARSPLRTLRCLNVTQQGAQQLSPSHTYAAALMHAAFRIIEGRFAASNLKKPSSLPSCLPAEHWLGFCTLCA